MKKFDGGKIPENTDRGNQKSSVQRLARLRESNRDWSERSRERAPSSASAVWKRQSFRLPREEARKAAREFLTKYPRAAYWSEIESWRVLEGDVIEFTMRRLPTAD
jgi:hypothetical protein